MAFAVANTAHTATSGGGSGSLTVPSTTINNLLLLIWSNDAGVGDPGITGGGTWATLGLQNDAGNGQDIGLSWALCTGSVASISFAGVTAFACAYAEFSGAATSSVLDVNDHLKAFQSATQDFTSNAITPATVASQTATCHTAANETGTIQIAAFKALSGSNELIIGGFGGTSGAGSAITATGSYAIATHGGVDAAEPGTGGVTGSAALVWLEAVASGGGTTTLDGVGGIKRPTIFVPMR